MILGIPAGKWAEVSAFRAPSSAERTLGDTDRPIVPVAFFEDIIPMWIRSTLSHLPKIREQVPENNAKQPPASNPRRLLRNRAAARSRRLLLAARPDHIVDYLQKIVCSEQLEQERIKPIRGVLALGQAA